MTPDLFVLSIAHLHPSPALLLASVDEYREAWETYDAVPLVDGEHPAHFVARVVETEAVLKDYAEPFSTQPGYPDAWR